MRTSKATRNAVVGVEERESASADNALLGVDDRLEELDHVVLGGGGPSKSWVRSTTSSMVGSPRARLGHLVGEPAGEGAAVVDPHGGLGPQPSPPGEHRTAWAQQVRAGRAGPQGCLDHGQDGGRATAAGRPEDDLAAAQVEADGPHRGGRAGPGQGRPDSSTAGRSAGGRLGQRQDRRCVWHPGPADALGKTGDGAGLHGGVRRAAEDRELHLPAVDDGPTGRRLQRQHVLGDVEGKVVVGGGHPQHDPALDRGGEAPQMALRWSAVTTEVHAHGRARRRPAR